jgi:hypothetical protein
LQQKQERKWKIECWQHVNICVRENSLGNEDVSGGGLWKKYEVKIEKICSIFTQELRSICSRSSSSSFSNPFKYYFACEKLPISSHLAGFHQKFYIVDELKQKFFHALIETHQEKEEMF